MSSFSNFPEKLELTVSRLEGGNLAKIAIVTKLGYDTENIFTAATGMLAEDYPPGTADVIAESRVMTIPCCKCKVQIQTTCYFHLLPTGKSGNIELTFLCGATLQKRLGYHADNANQNLKCSVSEEAAFGRSAPVSHHISAFRFDNCFMALINCFINCFMALILVLNGMLLHATDWRLDLKKIGIDSIVGL